MAKLAILFIATYTGLLGLSFLKHPIFGLFAYLLAFYMHPPGQWWGADLPFQRWSLLAAVVTLVATYVGPRAARRVSLTESAPAVLIALYAAWMWVQTAWAVHPAGAHEGAILFTKYVILILLIARCVDSRAHAEWLLWAHVAGCFWFSWVAWTDPRFSGGRLERVGGPGVADSNTLAIHCVTGLVAAGFLLLSSRSWWKKAAAIGASAFIMNTIVLCSSRGAFVAMAATGVLALIFAPKPMRKTVVACSVLAVALLGLVAHQQFWDRMQTTAQYNEEASAASRFVLIKPTFEMVDDYPLGVGHEGFRALSGRYCPPEILNKDGTRSPHTTILAVIAEQGWPGLAIYALLMIATFLELVRFRFREAAAHDPELGTFVTVIACSLAAFAVAGVTSSYLKAEVQIWMLGLMLALRVLAREEAAGREMRAARAVPAAAMLR